MHACVCVCGVFVYTVHQLHKQPLRLQRDKAAKIIWSLFETPDLCQTKRQMDEEMWTTCMLCCTYWHLGMLLSLNYIIVTNLTCTYIHLCGKL